MRKFVKRYIRKNCGECEIEQDAIGNVFVRKGSAESYPCVAAHLDQVQRNHSKDFEVIEGNDVVFGYSAKSRSQQGLGADDKNGIWIALECLREFSDLKVAFFVGEEIGCKGSGACDLTFFKDCRYVIQPDRMHGHDLITSMAVGDVCSRDFVKALGAKEYGYREENGSITDVGELVERGIGISCLNLSCGYYDAHTDHEFTVLSELQNCLDFVCHIIDTLTEKSYPFEYEGWGGYGRYGYYGTGHTYGGYYYQKPSKVSEPLSKTVSLGPSSVFKDDKDNDYYDCGFWDDDYDMMEQLLRADPNLHFEDIVCAGGWIENFFCQDKDVLRDIYDDVCEYYGFNRKKVGDLSDFWDEGDDDDTVGEIVFDKKVS
jgi:hypothetical protein